MSFADVVCHMSFVDVVCHMSLLTRFADVDLPDLTVIVCSPDPMVLIHFRFSALRASGFSNLKLKNLK
jgi:hypothetical protein